MKSLTAEFISSIGYSLLTHTWLNISDSSVSRIIRYNCSRDYGSDPNSLSSED